MNDMDRLLKALCNVTSDTFKDLSDRSPVVRFYAAKEIYDASSGDRHGFASVLTHMDANALRDAAFGDDWKVRRVASAAMRRVADHIGPMLGVDEKTIKNDPAYVCDVAQSLKEELLEFIRDALDDARKGISRPTSEMTRKFNI